VLDAKKLDLTVCWPFCLLAILRIGAVWLIDNIADHKNEVASRRTRLVSTLMGDSLSSYLTKPPGHLSLAVPPWVVLTYIWVLANGNGYGHRFGGNCSHTLRKKVRWM